MHTAQLMPLLLTVSCSSNVQMGFTFLVPAHLGSPGQRAVKRVCVLCVLDLCLGDKLSTVWTVSEWLLNRPGAVLAAVGYLSGLLV